MSGIPMYLMWPLAGPPPDPDSAERIYSDTAPLDLRANLCEWITSHVEMGDCQEIAEQHDLKPFLAFHFYSAILDEKRFPDGPWFTPEEMADAAEKLLSMLGNDHPDAIVLRNAFAAYALELNEGKGAHWLGLVAVSQMQSFIWTLQQLADGARNCRRHDIDRVALGVFDIFD